MLPPIVTTTERRLWVVAAAVILILLAAIAALGATQRIAGPWLVIVPGVTIMVLSLAVLRARSRAQKLLYDSNCRICPECRYRLEGLGDSGTCPECGRPFRVRDLQDYWSREYLLVELAEDDLRPREEPAKQDDAASPEQD